MDWCIENWQKSLNDARVLGSRSKENKVIHVYNTMLRLWPKEKGVTDLGVYLIGQKSPVS
jgi:hypothetical protein